jgi:hypothetical protein
VIAFLMSLLTSSALSTSLGALFAWLNRKTDIQVKQLELAHEQARWAHDARMRAQDLAIARIEAEGKERVALIEGDALVDAARMKAIAETNLADQVQTDEIKAAGWWGWAFVLVSVWRKAIRPGVTTVLLLSALVVNGFLLSYFLANWRALDLEQRVALGMFSAHWVCDQASACLGYWFLMRGASRA